LLATLSNSSPLLAVLPISEFLFKYKKITGGVWKLFHLVVRRRKGVRTFDVDELRGID
jgi:hypothetical protein